MGRVLRELLLLLGSAVTVCCACPKYCVCQNLSESLGTLCPSRGLLSVPPDIDRRTVELRLGGNFIVTVGRHDFADMGGLVDLTLSRNTIGSIQDRSFGDLESLRSLHLDANRLTEIGALALRGLANLQHLVINNNQLHTVEDGALDDFLDTLEDLDMSFNNLGGLPWASLGRMDNLHTLSLDHNLIDFIPEGTFARLHKMARLDLLSNRLRKLPPDPVFARCHTPPTPSPSYPLYSSSMPPPPMLSLTLGGNPLHCNCELLWFRRLSREDDMETCASPPRLQGRYFWLVPEGEFVCRPPLITQSGPDLRVLEGQGATLGCRASGDPEPAVHWVAPDGRLVGNSSRTAARWDGTLDILVATPRDHGTFTCIAANAAGEATAPVRLEVAPLPHPANASGGGGASPGRGSTPHQTSPQGTRLSDITGSGGKPHRGQARDRARPHNKVSVSQVTGNTALVSWTVPPSAPTVKMYQLQYNSSSDHVLVYSSS
ncbi:leucine-rich repeat and fibronectin type-III domain-containing protein 2 [Rhinoraja longicauda]